MAQKNPEKNPWNRVEEPKVEPHELTPGSRATKTTHPAFGHVQASRVSGESYLYGSDFAHQHFIRLSISRSELIRDLSNDWYHPREELIEISLSEAQWATMISSLNASGAQCTMRHIGRVPIPQLPAPKPRTEQFKTEAGKTLERVRTNLEAMTALLADLPLSGKKRAEMQSLINSAQSAFSGSLQFVVDQLGEHMEKTVEHAKVEVNAYITSAVNRAGLSAIAGGAPLVALTANPATAINVVSETP